MKKAVVLWLIYRKLRPALGISVAFILLSGVFLGVFNMSLVMAALGFFFIELFGAFYNDYSDFPEDIRNNRKDKFTTCRIISTKTCLDWSVIFAMVGFVFLFFTNYLLMFLGIFYLFLMYLYSNKKVHLKGRISGYLILSSPFLLLPPFVAVMNGSPLLMALPLSLFFFLQYMYILCQKDSTDPADKKNPFKTCGWKRATGIATLFAVSASIPLLFICIQNPYLIIVWAFNVTIKFTNLYHISKRTITRSLRGRIILLEYLTPYIYFAGGIL